MKAAMRAPAYVGIGLVYAYRWSFGLFSRGSCKYHPTCSQYALDALRRTGSCAARSLPAGAFSAATRGAAAGSTTPTPEAVPMILMVSLTPIEDVLRHVLFWLHDTSD